MIKKYELIPDKYINYRGKKLYRIRALIDFDDVSEGELGGYIESESNLSHEGDCWVYGDAMVAHNSKIYDNAKIYDDCLIVGNAEVYENAKIFHQSCIRANSKVHGNVKVNGNSIITENAEIFGDITIRSAWIGEGGIINKSGEYIIFVGLPDVPTPVTFYRTKYNDIACIDIEDEYSGLDSYIESIRSLNQSLLVDFVKRIFRVK